MKSSRDRSAPPESCITATPAATSPTDHRPPKRAKPSPPTCFSVPRNEAAILDLSAGANTPERRLKDLLLSENGANIIAAVGMGGSGKTTIVCTLGRDEEVGAVFYDGVWFIQLGQDITLGQFWAKIRRLVRKACPDFSERLSEMLAEDVGADDIALELMEELREKHFALIVDDVWRQSDVYPIVTAMAVEIAGHGGTLKMLLSTRGEDVAQNAMTEAVVEVAPRSPTGDIAKGIICHSAGIAVSVNSLRQSNFEAFEKVLRRCDGLPLALSVAGGTVRRLMKDTNGEGGEQLAWSTFCSSLDHDLRLLGDSGSLRHKDGVFACVNVSVQALEKKWPTEYGISAHNILRSLSIIAKQAWVPLDVLRLTWSVDESQAAKILDAFSESNLVARMHQNGVLGMRVHDLVVDCAMHLVREKKEGGRWEDRLLQGYGGRLTCIEPSEGESVVLWPWWNVKGLSGKYLAENLVRYMLRCNRDNEAIALLCDFRWIEFVNDDEERLPFQKQVEDLKLLQTHLSGDNYSVPDNSTDSLKTLRMGLRLMVEGMQMCMSHCARNRDECSFQLFGRLRELKQRCAVVKRCLWSMEAHARRPWVRPGMGLLFSVGRNLKRTLPVGFKVSSMELGLEDADLVVGGEDGELHVIDVHNGRERHSLSGHTRWITGIYADRSMGEVFTCSEDGNVIVWCEESQLRKFRPFEGEESTRVTCMEVFKGKGLIACGSGEGKIRLIDRKTGATVRDLIGHRSEVTSLVGTSGGKLLISRSHNCTVRKWDVESGEEVGEPLKGHEKRITCVAVSSDNRLIASGSRDKSVRLWDMQSGAKISATGATHRNWVQSVAFSGDAKLLCSGGVGEVFVWDVSSPQDGVNLKHKLRHDMSLVNSLCFSSDDTELFSASHVKREVFVWRAHPREDGSDEDASGGSKRDFLKGIRAVGVSPDGSTMATSDGDSIKVRRTRDVSDAVNDVLAQCDRQRLHLKDGFHFRRVAVTNDKQIVAFARNIAFSKHDLKVYIVRMKSADILHKLADLEDWLSSLGADASQEMSGSAHVSKLSFSSNCSTVTAVARVWQESDKNWLSKSLTWNVSTGTLCAPNDLPTAGGSECQPASGVISSGGAFPPLEVKSGDYYHLSDEVKFLGTANGVKAGTLEFNPQDTAYDDNTGRLWIVQRWREMCFLDLICDGAKSDANAVPAPRLPLLPRKNVPHEPGFHQPTKYTVFISHAGTDKLAFALPLHGALKDMGIEAFLDMINLWPGDNAPVEMINAMNSAPIGIFIISPQFAARPWTIKELMCFLERDRVAIEKGLPRPIIIPVFLRLTVAQCKDPALVAFKDENGDSVFEKEGFFEREKYGKASSEAVKNSMKRLAYYTGIENKEGASSNIVDGEPEEEGRKRERLIAQMANVIREACERYGIQVKGRA